MVKIYKAKIILSGLLMFAFAFGQVPAFGEEKSVGNLFIEAYDRGNKAEMNKIIQDRADEVPQEVKEMVEYAMSPDASPQEQDFLFNIAGTMAMIYGQVTGDKRLLEAVKGNFKTLKASREENSIPADTVVKIKKELTDLGKGSWKIVNFTMDQENGLVIDIDVMDKNDKEGFSPKIDIKTSNLARDIVKKHLPNVKKGKIGWSSIGVGLKMVFLE